MNYSLNDHRQSFERSNQGCQLPFFYTDEVLGGLNKLNYSLDVMITPERTMGGEDEKKYQQHRQEYVNNHSFWKFIPHRISIGNTYNVMPFASADFSTNNITNNNQSTISSNKKDDKEKKEEGIPTWARVLLVGGAVAFLYNAADALGRTIGEFNAANQDLNEVRKIGVVLENTMLQFTNMDLRGATAKFNSELKTIQEIVADKFLSQVRNNVLQNLMLKVGLIAGALIVITGALVNSYTLVIPGILLGILAGTVIVIKNSIAKNDQTIKDSASELKTKIGRLAIILNGVPHRQLQIYPDGQIHPDNELLYFQNRIQHQQGYPIDPQQIHNSHLGASAPNY